VLQAVADLVQELDAARLVAQDVVLVGCRRRVVVGRPASRSPAASPLTSA
jgi:hypothetical protein